MTLLVVGINHNTAVIALRERVSVAPENLMQALRSAGERCGGSDVAILSTCNRTEVYVANIDDSQKVLDWLEHFHGVSQHELSQCVYFHEGDAAARHMMLVASGLDSLVLGEPQILGQMKTAFSMAQEAGTASGDLQQVFQQVFAVAKRVRAETAIGRNPVSVAYAAVRLARRIFSDLGENTALLIGAGKTIELVARHLQEQGIGKILIANRSLPPAQALASEVGGEALVLGEIPMRLHEADIVISSTASQLPILGKGAVEQALIKRRHQPMFMVDIAVPRDIEEQVALLDDVYLYTVDDLRDVIDEGLRAREMAAEEARILIEEGVARFQSEKIAQKASLDIVALRKQAEIYRDNELEKSLKQLARGENPELVLRQFGRNLTNKLLHHPTEYLRKRKVIDTTL
jgi:glutamyl-tRNA reductase